MNNRLSAFLFASACIVPGLLASTVQAESIYKWVDKGGVVHYGQVPEGENATQLSGNKPGESLPEPSDAEQPAQAADNASKPVAKPNAQYEALRKDNEAARAEIEQQNAAIAKRNEEISNTNCSSAKERLVTIQSGGKMYSVNPAGEREYWDDARREAETQTAQDAIGKWCKE